MKMYLLNMEHNRRWMLDERIVALKLQKLHKGTIKVIPNEEYSESSETIRQLYMSHYSLSIFIQFKCGTLMRHARMCLHTSSAARSLDTIKREKRKSRRKCARTSLVLACIIVMLNLNARKRKRPQYSPLKNLPKCNCPTALL